jgi:hypothetical protein
MSTIRDGQRRRARQHLGLEAAGVGITPVLLF